MKRESFGSRLGFLLVSAGCAIGLGNVWKFPYMCGINGGAAFIVIYLVFLVALGIPILSCEFAMGRSSRQSIAKCYEELEPKNTRWHNFKYIGILGNYMLMMFYTMVGGWMLYYCVRSLRGDFVNAEPKQVETAFNSMLSQAPTMIFWTVLICVLGFSVCIFGLQNGIEKITKIMMIALLSIMIVLAIRAVTMSGAEEGIRYYLVPDFDRLMQEGIGNVIFAALSQAFFTLSIGIGAMLIFGSYLDRSRKLYGEAISVTVLDTMVALLAGLLVIPACFAYGIQPEAGPGLVFITLPNIFSQMSGGRIWSSLFFLFLTFAALSTIIAVFENIIAMNMELFQWSRKKAVGICMCSIILLSMPCVLGFNVLSGVTFVNGGNIMDLEDFIVSNNLLPLGSLCCVLFCTRENGWGWNAFMKECNTGEGISFPQWMKSYMSYGIPAIIIVIYLKGYYDMFKKSGMAVLIFWMLAAFAFLGFIFYVSTRKGEKNAISSMGISKRMCKK